MLRNSDHVNKNIFPGALSLLLVVLFGPITYAQTADQRDPFFPQQPVISAPTATVDQWGRDPFNNPFVSGGGNERQPAEGDQERTVTGIITGKGTSIAIIGGRTVREGDAFGDKRVVRIRKNSVILIDRTGTIEELFLEDYSRK